MMKFSVLTLSILCWLCTYTISNAQTDNSSGQVLKIRDKLQLELDTKSKIEKTVSASEIALSQITQIADGDAKVTEYIRLYSKAGDIILELTDAQARQLELFAILESAKKETGIPPQISSYLKEAELQLRTLGVHQSSLKQRLEKLRILAAERSNRVPPPAEFTNKSGMKMRLVKSSTAGFYISVEPLPLESGTSFQAALKQAAAVSAAEGESYRLPGINEVKLLAAQKLIPPCPVWTSAKPGTENLESLRMRERFGVQMQLIWDPKLLLGIEQLFPELPAAEYPGMKLILMTNRTTGTKQRLQKAYSTLNEK